MKIHLQANLNMTVNKAIKILDWWINKKKHGIEKLKEEWDYSDDDYGITKTLLNADRITITNLDMIRKELVPNCNHPEKMRDKTPDGQLYCMNCNLDL